MHRTNLCLLDLIRKQRTAEHCRMCGALCDLLAAQVFQADGAITNIIDLGPRLTSILPVPGDSILRQKVGTRGAARGPARVGLTFESVTVKPVSLLGQDLGALPPLKLDLPRLTLFGSRNIGAESEAVEGPGYFDVLYLDGDFLAIKQNEPGGLFVFTRRKDLDGAL